MVKPDGSFSRAPQVSVERREPLPPSLKRKDHDSGEPDREGGKRPRRFEDVDAYGDDRGKGDKGSSSRQHKMFIVPNKLNSLIVQNQFGEAQAKEQKQKEEIPDIEPWDSKYLISGTYEDISLQELNMDKITIYVEHREPLEPPAEPAPPPPQPLKLTKKGLKKIRTQRHHAKEKDRQDMIRQGLLEPPKPKVKMSNLMKVLGVEATQDPTRTEMEIRAAAAEREQAHMDRNIARKLTPSERHEKKERKLFDDPNKTLDYIVWVYIIRDLSHRQTRIKVDANARENRLTGAAVITDGVSIVIVEGGKKPINRYNNLMLNRIDWAAAVGGEDGADEEPDKPVNSCTLVWQGSVMKPSFPRWFGVHKGLSEAAAKKVFVDAKVPYYWDLAVNFLEDYSS